VEKTWSQPLFINKDAGIIDVVVAPKNFNIMYAVSWERERRVWNFDGDGNHSGIYKSIDAITSWTKMAEKSGFLTGNEKGRIRLAVLNEITIYMLCMTISLED
jgi:hypothetical protein